METAYQRGLADGKQQGYQRAHQELASEYSIAAELARQWHEKVEEATLDSEVNVVRLAYEIAKKVIHREIQADPDLIQYVVREAVRRISNASRAVVRLNPADLERIEGDRGLVKELRDRVRHLNFKGDETITTGGCIVEANVGVVDATLESQLNEIETNLFGDFADAA